MVIVALFILTFLMKTGAVHVQNEIFIRNTNFDGLHVLTGSGVLYSTPDHSAVSCACNCLLNTLCESFFFCDSTSTCTFLSTIVLDQNLLQSGCNDTRYFVTEGSSTSGSGGAADGQTAYNSGVINAPLASSSVVRTWAK